MSQDIATLQFRADTGDIKSANNELDKLATSARKVESAADGAREAIRKMGQNGGNGVKQTAADVEILLNKINPTTKAFDELDKTMRQLSSARNQKLIDTEQFKDFSAILDRQRTALQKTYDDLTGYSDKVKQAENTQKQATAARQADIASLGKLRQVLDPVGEATKKLQEQFTLLTKTRLSGLISSGEYTQLRTQLTELNKAAKEGALSAGQLRQGWSTASYQLRDVFVSLASGMNPLTVAMQQLPTLALSFGSFGRTLAAFAGLLNPVAIGITALVGGLGYMGYQAYQSSQQMDALQKALNSTGNISGATARQLKDLSQSLADSTKTSQSTAANAVAIATSLGGSAEQIRQFSQAALQLSKSTGQGVEEILQQFKRIAKDPVDALKELNDQYHFSSLALYEQVKAMSDAGDKTGAQTLIVNELTKATKEMALTTDVAIRDSTGFWDNLAFSISNAWESLKQYNAENKSTNAGIGGFNGYDKSYDPYGVKKQADESAASWDRLSKAAGTYLADVTAVGVESKKFTTDQLNANLQADQFLKTSRTNEQIRADLTKDWTRQLKEGLITQQKFNSLVDAANEKYKDPKGPRAPKTAAVKVDQGDKLTDQYAAQNLALDAQIKLLQNRAAYETNASTQRKAYLELEAKYTILEQASATRKLTVQEQQILAVKDEALAQAKILADKGDQLATLQRQAQVSDEITKLQDTQSLSAEVYAEYQGRSTKEMQRQLEIAQARAAVLAKGGTSEQANVVEQIKQIDFKQADDRAADWVSGMKTGLADWADAASNYAKIAGDAVQKGMNTATDAVANFALTGKLDFADFTKSILKMIVEIISQLLVMNALKSGASALGFGGLFANAKGGVYSDPSLSKFSNGVFDSPQLFQFGGRSQFAKGGVFAEAGPEAIMPLSRDSNGRLGVKAEGGGGGAGVNVNQTINVSSDGRATSNTSTTGDAMGRALGDQMSAAAMDVLRKAMQPGGIIYRYNNG